MQCSMQCIVGRGISCAPVHKKGGQGQLKAYGVVLRDLTGIIFCMQDAGKGEPVCSPCYVGQTRRSAPAKGGGLFVKKFLIPRRGEKCHAIV